MNLESHNVMKSSKKYEKIDQNRIKMLLFFAMVQHFEIFKMASKIGAMLWENLPSEVIRKSSCSASEATVPKF